MLLYNVMFVVPLVVVTAASFLGARNQRLVDWSRTNVVWSKSLMGAFFAALAILMVAT